MQRTAGELEVADPALERIEIVCVSPRNGGNIGAAARAIKNMGLGGLAIAEPSPYVDPQRFEEEAERLAVEAQDTLARARRAPSLDELLSPSTYLAATTAKPRRRSTPVTLRQAAPQLLDVARHRPVAVLFGREDHGLPERVLGRASMLVRIPSDPAYPVLNLAQSVMLVAYELRQAALESSSSPLSDDRPEAAELDGLYQDVDELLSRADFFKPHNRDRILAELHGLAAKARPGTREVNLLRGICRQIRWLLNQPGQG